MSVPIAELMVVVGADVSAAISNLTDHGTQVEGLAGKFQAAQPAALLSEGHGGVEAGLLSSVKVAADFEHQMSGVKAVMAPTEVNQFGDALGQLAIVLGRDTVFASRESRCWNRGGHHKGRYSLADVLGGAASAALSLAAALRASRTPGRDDRRAPDDERVRQKAPRI